MTSLTQTLLHQALPRTAPPAVVPVTKAQEGDVAMYTMLGIGFVASIAAAIIAEFDPRKWADLVVAVLLAVSAISSTLFFVAMKLIRLMRKLQELIRSVPTQVETHVAKAIDASEIPTTPKQKDDQEERIATAVAKKIVQEK